MPVLHHDLTTTTRLRRTCVRLLAVVAMTGSLAAIGSVAPHAANAAQPGVTEVARTRLPATDIVPNNDIMLDPGARRLLLWTTTTPQQLVAYDLDTLQPVGHVDLLTAGTAGTHTIGFPWSLDARRHVLFHEERTGTGFDIYGIDTRTLKTVVDVPLPGDIQDSYAGLIWSARDGLLYSVYAPSPLNFRDGVAFFAVDPYAQPSGAVVWRTPPVRGCAQTFTNNDNAPLGETRDGRYLFTVCSTGNSLGADVVRMALPAAAPSGGIWATTADLYPGLPAGMPQLAQWVPALDRMVAVVPAAGGRTAYVFDAATQRYIAAPALFVPPHDSNVSYDSIDFGVDPASGRLFARSRGIASYGRGSNGAPCEAISPDSTSIALLETGLPGVATLHFPGGDEHMVGDDHFVGYDSVRHNWVMFELHEVPWTPCNGGPGTDDAAYLVAWHDSVPPASAPAAADPDAGTRDIPEQPGSTGALFSADGSAYGQRLQFGPSGVEGTVGSALGATCDLDGKLASAVATSPVPPPVGGPPLPQQYHAFCNGNARTATFAHVDQVLLDGSEVRATAITGDTDRDTGRDLSSGSDLSQPGPYADAVFGYASLPAGSVVAVAPAQLQPCPPPADARDGQPTRCDEAIAPAQPYLSGAALPYVPASCSDSGGAAATDTTAAPLQLHGQPSPSPLDYPGSASVWCSDVTQQAGGHAEQSGSSASGPLGAPVAARTATADVTVDRSAGDGSSAVATSTVHDISIAGILHIASLTATAAVVAHGRPGSNRPVYQCSVTGLQVTLPAGDALPPGVPDTVASAPCDDPRVTAITDAVNSAFTGSLRVEFPPAPSTADHPAGGDAGAVMRQSPRGFLSEVALSDLDQAQDVILMNDPSLEKPALVATLYVDTANSRNRVVASFAGVAATARYGIFPLDSGDGSSGGDDGSDVPTRQTDAMAPLVADTASAGLPPLAPAVTSAPATPPAAGGWRAVPAAIVDGVRFLLQHPGFIPPLLATWLLLLAPAYALSRRRALLRLT